MPNFTADQLRLVSRQVLEAAGVPAEDATIVAAELCDANLVGHDSHGVMRLVQYVEMIEQGFVIPGGSFEVLRQQAAFALVDGHFNLGQVIASKALDLAMGLARDQGTGTVLVKNCCHVGRLGSYTERAAAQGCVALMAVNAPGPGGVAPFGGMERRLGTTPISIAAPSPAGNLVLDMTTSATAEGKLRVAHQKGESIPEGLIIDGHGRPSTNPADYYTKPYGAILPLGGPLLGHKGYALSVMLDVICGMLSGSGVCRDDLPRGANGVWMYLLDIEQFLPRPEFDVLMETYRNHLKSCRTMPGVEEILLPGELELRRHQQRSADGIAVPDETWRQIGQLAERLNVSLDGLAP